MGDPDYFEQTTPDNNVKQNIVALSFIQHSVNTRDYQSVTSNINAYNARVVYKALKNWFIRPSWSLIILNPNVIFNNNKDQLYDINNFSLKVNEAIWNLENIMGPVNGNTMETLAMFYAVPTMKHHITAAINTLMATNPNLAVRPYDLLNMIQQIDTALPSFDHSTEIARMNAASRFGQRNMNHNPSGNRQYASHSRLMPTKPQYYTKNTRNCNANNPCHYCGEVGHCSPDCLIKAKVTSAKNQHCQPIATVARMGIVPTLEEDDGLLDLGATHLVVGNISLFTSLKPTDMVLSVALSHSFKVNGIGEIRMNTAYGSVKIRNFLYCKHISGAILFDHPLSIKLANVTANLPAPILDNDQNDDVNLLWHWRLVQKPGDLIVSDLMGPFPPSINDKRYALTIKDAFPRVTMAIALNEQSEAKN
ncbi:hypothetical protein O181_094218 [Austropuccinia psidii MF-1]|uniref:CCHC-type domain-containing protein n=1 Tax=Austropuccinia psidii MF-1 TaxID=1389203 RepID=A0A9Q3J2Q8_9BASI|nr:hypothetical protein [Austropuccinia psidii MF-1]